LLLLSGLALGLSACYQATPTPALGGGMFRMNVWTGHLSWCRKDYTFNSNAPAPIRCYDETGKEEH
jgi:hypothetical protein